MFNSILEKISKKKCLIRFNGELTIDNADEIKKILVEAITRFNIVEIVFENVIEVDISYLQLLCSAHKSAHKQNKTILFPVKLPEPFTKGIHSAGFRRQIGCFKGEPENCFWLVSKLNNKKETGVHNG